MRIAAPGPWLIVGGLAAAGGLGLVWPPLAAAGLAFAGFSAFFFRDPERAVATDPGAALAPGDGRVLTVKREGEEEGQTLRIFLSVFDVHVQRFPFAGRVTGVEHHKGPFRIACLDDAVKNERKVLTMELPEGPAVIEQITGAVARRIRCYAAPGDEVEQGQRLGIIYFGSQVALHVPKGWEFTVRPGDRVVGGVTVIARRVAARSGNPDRAAAAGESPA